MESRIITDIVDRINTAAEHTTEDDLAIAVSQEIELECDSDKWTLRRLAWVCAILLPLHEYDPRNVLWDLATRILSDMEMRHLRADLAKLGVVVGSTSSTAAAVDVTDLESLVFVDFTVDGIANMCKPFFVPDLPTSNCCSADAEKERFKASRVNAVFKVVICIFRFALKDDVCRLDGTLSSPEWMGDYLPKMYDWLRTSGANLCSPSIIRKWSVIHDNLVSESWFLSGKRAAAANGRSGLENSVSLASDRSRLMCSEETVVPLKRMFATAALPPSESTQDSLPDFLAKPRLNPAIVLWKIFRRLWSRVDRLCLRTKCVESHVVFRDFIDAESLAMPLDITVCNVTSSNGVLNYSERARVLNSLKRLNTTWLQFLGVVVTETDKPAALKAPMLFQSVHSYQLTRLSAKTTTSSNDSPVEKFTPGKGNWYTQVVRAEVSRLVDSDPQLVAQALPACIRNALNKAGSLKDHPRRALASFLASVFPGSEFRNTASILEYLGFNRNPESPPPGSFADHTKTEVKVLERLKGIDGWLSSSRKGMESDKKPFIMSCGSIIKAMAIASNGRGAAELAEVFECPFAASVLDEMANTDRVVDIEDIATRSCRQDLGIEKDFVASSSIPYNALQAWVTRRNK